MHNNEISLNSTLHPDYQKIDPDVPNSTKAAKSVTCLKKIIFLTGIATLGILGSGCTTGYVATEPAYVEYNRPPRPSDNHIWIEGNYVYNRPTHVYVQKNGYWKKSGSNSTYVSGHWQSTPRGQYWVKGHRQRNRR